jgi:hypothetical protein
MSPKPQSPRTFSTIMEDINSRIEKTAKGTVNTAYNDSQLEIRLVCRGMQRWISCSSHQSLKSIANMVSCKHNFLLSRLMIVSPTDSRLETE